jgi:uncharacterized protein with GYD domain
MATFILLESFTDQGIRNVKGTVSRSADFRALARKQGGIIKEVFWTQGRYDVVAILEAPNEETAAAIALNLASAGNIRLQTLRAFTPEEMQRILENVG